MNDFRTKSEMERDILGPAPERMVNQAPIYAMVRREIPDPSRPRRAPKHREIAPDALERVLKREES